jgi:LytS/YehU family sensor histidine kinase
MAEILKLIIYFLVGVVQDFFFTMNSKYIAQEKVASAVIFSFLTILMSTVVLYNILNDINSETSIIAIVVYSAGIATGTYVAMKFPKFKKRRK